MDERMVTFEDLLALSPADREAFIMSLPAKAVQTMAYSWDFWARPNQRIPGNVNPKTDDGTWATWFINAGRGFGKTRTGAETVRKWVRQFPLVNLIGATAADARDIMIEGESGILAICPKPERPSYIPSKAQLNWPNGAKSLIFTADEPERLRGKQHMKVWADELGSWRYRDAWDQMVMGLRLGDSPQAVVTSTPRPTALVREILADPTTVVTTGTTYDNRANLAKSFFTRIITKYEGTRLGRQELNAELLLDNPNALWNRELIDRYRFPRGVLPDRCIRVVVGVDPAVTSNEDSDETGVVVAAMDDREVPHFYVFEDASIAMATPDQWAQRVVDTFKTYDADRVIGEVNNGGDLVEAIIRSKMPSISYEAVRATRGKVTRAEPIAALYEQGRVHHVGTFSRLEDQLCEYNPITSTKSPDRLDALVWALTQLSSDDYSPDPATAGTRRMR